jgi:Ni/Fe-hydrogenase subunit HybB-like protein
VRTENLFIAIAKFLERLYFNNNSIPFYAYLELSIYIEDTVDDLARRMLKLHKKKKKKRRTEIV